MNILSCGSLITRAVTIYRYCRAWKILNSSLPFGQAALKFCFPGQVLDPIHTNPFSNENGAVLLQIRLLTTLQRWKWSLKTEPFKNALQSGAIWKRCFLKTLFSSVDRENNAIWKQWRHQNRHNRVPDYSTVSIQSGGQTLQCGFCLDRRCSALGQKRYENNKWGHKSFWKWSKTAPFLFSKWVWKVTCSLGKSTRPRWPDGTFFEPCTVSKSPLNILTS